MRRLDRNTKSSEKPSKTSQYLKACDLVLQPIVDLVKTLQPPKIWEDMSPLFYTSFWTLSCSDLAVPTAAYEKQRNSIQQKFKLLDDNQELNTAKKKKEKEKLMNLLDKLSEEENKQKDHVAHVKARLDIEKDQWFPQSNSSICFFSWNYDGKVLLPYLENKTKNETISEFLQLCIFPRCLFTVQDAVYCAKFIQNIHSLKTPNFSTIICYDRVSLVYFSLHKLTYLVSYH